MSSVRCVTNAESDPMTNLTSLKGIHEAFAANGGGIPYTEFLEQCVIRLAVELGSAREAVQELTAEVLKDAV